MADFNEMEGLELPSLDGLDSPLEQAAPAAKTENDDISEMVADISDDDFSDIDMPVLSDMYGEEISAAPVSEAAKQEAKPASAPAAVAVMNPEPVRSGSYTPVSQNSAPAYTPTASYSQSSSSADSFFSMYDEKRELYESGRKKVKLFAVILIVIEALDILASLLSFNIYNLALSAAVIYFIVNFMKNGGRMRWYIGASAILNAISSVKGIMTVSEFTSLFAEYNLSFLTTILQLFFIGSLLFYLAMAYFFLLDKSVAEFSERG